MDFETPKISEFPRKIMESDISREVPSLGGTKIIEQRHEKYERNMDAETPGSLTAESAPKAREQSKRIFAEILKNISEDEREAVEVLVLGSTTKYQGKGQRSIETASMIIEGVRDAFEEAGIDPDQHLLNQSKNISGQEGTPRPTHQIQAPRMFDDSPEFVQFLKDTYGNGKENQQFWQAYEDDLAKDTREEMGAEASLDVAQRFAEHINLLNRFAHRYHQRNEGRRLVIWVASHYDTISPYLKNFVLEGMNPNQYMNVDYGAGFSIDVEPGEEDSPTTVVNGKLYNVPVKMQGKGIERINDEYRV